jgi:hypothetical protein
MPICGASRAARSLPGSIIGQIESYLELHETHATVGLPTVSRSVETRCLTSRPCMRWLHQIQRSKKKPRGLN